MLKMMLAIEPLLETAHAHGRMSLNEAIDHIPRELAGFLAVGAKESIGAGGIRARGETDEKTHGEMF